MIPQRAVRDLQGLTQVAVVGADDKVTFKTVKLGPATGSDYVVSSGLAAGERVVTEGLQKIRDGMLVKPADGAAGSSRRSAPRRRLRVGLADVPILHRPPDRGDRDCDPHGGRRPGDAAAAADRAVPGNRPSHHPDQCHLHRCRRHHGRAVRRHADRTADERRAGHDLHEVHQRQRRHPDAAGELRRRNRRQPGSGLRAEPALAGDLAATAQREQLRPHGAADRRPAPAGDPDLLARRDLQRQLPGQLRHHQRHRRAGARSRRRPGQAVRDLRLRDAHLGAAGHAREAPAHRHRSDRTPCRRRTSSTRPDRSAPSPRLPARSSPTASPPRAGWYWPSSSARSSCARIRTARWCACATWRGSTSARSTTCRSAATRASPPPPSRSTSRRARTRSPPATRSSSGCRSSPSASRPASSTRSRSTPRSRSARASPRSCTRSSRRWCS